MGKNRLQTWFLGIWQPVLTYGAVLSAALFLLLFRLGSLVPGLATQEQAEIQATTIADIKSNLIYAPYKALQFVILNISENTAFTARLTAALGGLVAIGLMYYIVRHWFSWRVAAITTLLFATSPWFLHNVRFSQAAASQLAILALIALGTRLKSGNINPVVIFLCALAVGGALYTPGLWVFIGLGLIWQWKTIILLYRRRPLLVILSLLGCLCLLMPLVWTVSKDLGLVKTYLGLPVMGLRQTLIEIPNNLYTTLVDVVWKGPATPALWLGTMPLLNFFALIIAILGLYNYYLDFSLDRTKFVVGGLFIAWFLVALGGPMTNLLLLPFCYLLVASGIAFMLKQWFKVFPFNPFARSLALGLLALAIVTVCWYNVSHYFIAWPQAPATIQAFSPTQPVVQ